MFIKTIKFTYYTENGGVPEWLKGMVSKTIVEEILP